MGRTASAAREAPTHAAAPAPAVPAPADPVAPPARTGATHRYRTEDVVSDAGSFADLLLPPPLVTALAGAGFARPSPVQKLAIPLAGLGVDVIVQAKSGTGKTCVFAVAALQRVDIDLGSPQVLVLAPTREVALQSADVVQRIAAGLPAPAPACTAFVGGLPTVEDQKRLRRTCHIVVGTPGRIGALLTSGALATQPLRLLVLDEADALVDDGFYDDAAWIAHTLPVSKQVLAFSATYTPELLAALEPLMRRPQKVLLCEETVSLRGIRQFYHLLTPAGGASQRRPDLDSSSSSPGCVVDGHAVDCSAAAAATGATAAATAADSDAPKQALLVAKVDALLELLSRVSFHQAVVFCNRKPAAEWLATRLSTAGYPAAALTADLPQPARMEALAALRDFKLRVLVATDVMARGVDLERVNLVALLDAPPDAATYVHRVGRTGRFGTRGVSVALVAADELERLRGYLAEAHAGTLEPLPDVVPPDLYAYDLGSQWERDALQSLLQAPTATQSGSPPPVRHRHLQRAAREPRDPADSAAAAADGGALAAGAPGVLTSGVPGVGADEDAWQAWQIHQAWEVWEAWQRHYAVGGRAGEQACSAPATVEPADDARSLLWRRRASDHASSGSLRTCSSIGASSSSSDDGLEPHARALLDNLAVAACDAPS